LLLEKTIIEPLTTSPNSKFYYDIIKVLKNIIESSCLLTDTGSEYTGDIRVTTDNQNCQRWDSKVYGVI